MRSFAILVVILIFSAIPALAQVDTLQLVEIGSIEAPGEITNLYVEDLDGDSLKEIILTTAANVHIYNGITYEEIWISPELDHPRDLLFADINLDGFTDFSVKDSTNIRLFDAHNDAIIWTSPALDSTYKCYTIGDSNDDEWVDMIIAFRHEGGDNTDSLHIDLIDGPQFDSGRQFYLRINNYEYWSDDYHIMGWEEPNRLTTVKMNYDGTERSMVVLFTDQTVIDEWWHENSSEHYTQYKGRAWVADGEDLTYYRPVSPIGSLLHFSCQEIDGNRVLISLLHSIAESIVINYSPWSEIGNRHFDIVKAEYSPDSLIGWGNLYSRFDLYQDFPDWPPIEWEGLAVDDIDPQVEGDEVVLSAFNWLRLYRYPGTDTLWEVEASVDLDTLLYVYNANDLFDAPRIICQVGDPATEFRFYSGLDGSLSSILLATGQPVSSVCDLDRDDNDEILSLDAANLYIYGLQRTAIKDEQPLPDRDLLLSSYPNPFNSTTTIEYGLPEAGHVRIEIYDLLGRKVETLVDQELEAGHHRVIWDAGEHTSGVYFYRVVAGDLSETKRMVLLK
jgi:hypothetical protein